MKFNIVGKNIRVTDGLRDHVESKLSKLKKYFNDSTEINVTLSTQKDEKKIEVTIPVKGGIIRSEQASTDMYVSIDLVEEIIERQLRKYKTKLIDRHRGIEGISFTPEFIEEEDLNESDSEIKIAKTKHFSIRPMYPEDACLEMELLGHSFYVFINAETEEVSVVYKRKDGSYGLIEPEY
ncbi:MAG: ribosome-associated translation inhibitor RaiA [Lachnospiraceae bacterium]|nr:ribosome-associated translation inhibitor RaiA [Lachnospiraceae bacterium]